MRAAASVLAVLALAVQINITTFDGLAPTTTRGDVIYRNATTNTRLAAGTAGQMLCTQGASADPTWCNHGYDIFMGHGAWSPADLAVSYWGAFVSGGPSTTQGIERVGVTRTGTITRVELTILIVTTNGSGESTTMTLQVNGVDQATLSAAKVYNGGVNTRIEVSYTGLSVAVTAGDHIEFKETSPTWATNPVNIIQAAHVYVTVP